MRLIERKWIVAGMSLVTALAGAVPAGAIGPGDLTQFNSKYYTIHTNLTRGEANDYARHMDTMFAEYQRRFASFRKRDRRSMPLYLLRTRDQYISLLAGFGFNVSATGGVFFYSRRANGLATWVKDIDRERMLEVLQHEGFHQFAHAYIGPDLPVWVNEGLAEYFGDGLIVRNQMKLGFATENRLKKVQQAVRGGIAIGFDDLLDISNNEWHNNMTNGSERGHLQYHQSWSIVYFLIHGDRGRYRGAFEQYLGLVSSGRNSSTAFRQAFKTQDTTAFRKRWEGFIKYLKPDAFTTAVARIQFLGRGLSYLRKHDRPIPGTLDELRQALQKVNFRLTYKNHGSELIKSAKDESYYSFRRPNGGQSPFTLLEAEGEGLLPRIVAAGLRPEPMLVWSRDKTGGLESEVRYK